MPWNQVQVIRSAAQLLADIVDQMVGAAAFADDPRQRLAADRLAGRKIVDSTRCIHSRQRASGGR